MENPKFWNEANDGNIRQKAAVFMEQIPVLSRLKGNAYYKAEDAIVDFIKTNREAIYREVDREYLRDDVIQQVSHGGDVECSLSIEEIDEIIDDWQDRLGNSDTYWEANWDALSGIIEERKK